MKSVMAGLASSRCVSRFVSRGPLAATFVLTCFLSTFGQEKFGDKDFWQYQLSVHCDPGTPSVIFNARSKGVMGTKSLCAGKCPGGKAEKIDDVLALLPDDVSSSFRKQLADYEASAATGKGTSLTPCLQGCGSQAWEDYQRDLKIVLGIWDDADAEFDRGLEEFHEASEDILKDMVDWPVAEISEEVLGDIATEESEKLIPIVRKLIKKTGRGKIVLKELGGKRLVAYSVAGTVIAISIEASMVAGKVDMTLTNLDRSSLSQHKMRLQAHEKWKQALDDLERALAKDKECADKNAEIAAKAKSERKLEEQARQYLQDNFDNFHKTYRIGGNDYKDAAKALEAAKKIIQTHYSRRSGYVPYRSNIQLTAYSPSDLGSSNSLEPWEDAIRQMELAEAHVRKGTGLIVEALRMYRNIRGNLDSIKPRVGKGIGPIPSWTPISFSLHDPVGDYYAGENFGYPWPWRERLNGSRHQVD